MKIFSVNLVDYMNDSALRCDVKFYHTMSESGWNLFNAPEENNLRLADIIKEDYALCTYQDNIEYKGIPTGQTFLDDDGDIIDFQPVTSDNHPGRLKYTVTSDHILISSLRLAKSPALNFDIANLNEYVFSNGFYIFKVKDGWNKRFVLYLLRSHKLKAFLNNNLYRGIGISAYKAEDLLKIKISNIPLESQNEAVTHIASIENNIKKLKSKINSNDRHQQYLNLFKEYEAYIFDSAVHYAKEHYLISEKEHNS
ncbi:MAG: restriction endonuclease subunit S, partial [Lachnoclostridium sp.]|nr:restriction endonuclease subunit S [Lachnoclostridium sp.]